MKDPQISVDHLERIDAILLSFVASYVDTAVFVGLFGLFTSHVTGNFTQATIDALAIVSTSAPAPDRDAAARRFARMWPAIAAFTIGAALGAFGFIVAGLLCLVVPAALCLVLAARFGGLGAASCS